MQNGCQRITRPLSTGHGERSPSWAVNISHTGPGPRRVLAVTWGDAGDRLGDLGKHPHNSHSGAQAGTGAMEGECVPAVYLACGGPNLSVRTGSGAPFQPVFPTPDAVSPLTAEVLFHLGI